MYILTIKTRLMCIQVSLAVRGGYVPENCREWQNRERQDISSMRIVVLRS